MCFVRGGHAANSNVVLRTVIVFPDLVLFLTILVPGFEHHIAALDLCELLHQSARSIAQPRAAHPLSERLPWNIRQETNQDVGSNAIFILMPDGADGQFIVGDAKRPPGFGELDVSLPQRGRIEIV